MSQHSPQNNWPVPYCKTQVVKKHGYCGNKRGNIGLTITWELDPFPVNDGFILQHVDIREPEVRYQDYTEAWPVTNGVIGNTTNREWAPNKDHFCVEKSHLEGDSRTYVATAWFVEGDINEANMKNLTKSRQKRRQDRVPTAGSLRHIK